MEQRAFNIPMIDISQEAERHVILAQGTEESYKGHPTLDQKSSLWSASALSWRKWIEKRKCWHRCTTDLRTFQKSLCVSVRSKEPSFCFLVFSSSYSKAQNVFRTCLHGREICLPRCLAGYCGSSSWSLVPRAWLMLRLGTGISMKPIHCTSTY